MNPVEFFKCLADETRLRSLLLIAREGELCVCELSTALEAIQPKVSRHLALLRKCALLIDQRRGQWVFYQINPALPTWAKDILSLSLANNDRLLREDIQRLNHMGSRPERQQQCC